jgi:hypothetical protein
MKYLKLYSEQSELCNEGIRDYLKPKSEDEIKDKLDNLLLPERINTIIRYKLYSEDKIKEIINSLSISELKEILRYNSSFYKFISKENIQKMYPIIHKLYDMIKCSPFWKIKGLRDYQASQFVHDSILGKLIYDNLDVHFTIHLINYKTHDHVDVKIKQSVFGDRYVEFKTRTLVSGKNFKDIYEFYDILSTNPNFPEPLRKYFKIENAMW